MLCRLAKIRWKIRGKLSFLSKALNIQTNTKLRYTMARDKWLDRQIGEGKKAIM